MSEPGIKIIKHTDAEGVAYPHEYDVLVNGQWAGRVYRREGVSDGYFGRWVGAGRWTDTRKSAVAFVVATYRAQKGM